MSREQIVEQLARAKRVEQIIRLYDRSGAPELEDLAQIVYLALLQKPEPIVQDLWEQGGIGGAINFYIKAIVRNQVYTNHSTYRDLYDKYKSKATEINGREKVYEQDWWEKPHYERGE